MPEGESIGELFLIIKKKNEELETLIKDLRMENAALRTENDCLRSKPIPQGNNNNREYTI